MANIDPKVGFITQSGAFGSSNTVRLEITNFNEVMKIIRDIDSDWIGELRSEFKAVGRVAAQKVQKAIPSKNKPPLENMRQVYFGRLAWGTTWSAGAGKPRPAKSVLVQLPNTRKKKYRELERVPIVRLQIGSPGTVLFDMAYRKLGAKGRKGKTPIYDYMYTIGGQKVPGKRQHTVVPYAFAKGIAKSDGRQASRIVYPAVIKSMPEVTYRMKVVLFKANQKIQAAIDSRT